MTRNQDESKVFCKCACRRCVTAIRLDDYTYPLCSACDHEGCTTTKSPLTVSRKAVGHVDVH